MNPVTRYSDQDTLEGEKFPQNEAPLGRAIWGHTQAADFGGRTLSSQESLAHPFTSVFLASSLAHV